MSDTWSICGPWRLETFSEDIPYILVTAHFNDNQLEGEISISYEKEDNEKKRKGEYEPSLSNKMLKY